MKILFTLLLSIACWFFAATEALGATIFETSFESSSLGSSWQLSWTNNGRAIVTSDNAPATGTRQLVFDDTLNDAIYSSIEATLRLDLSYKKNVVLSFKAKSLGNEPNPPPSGNFTTTRNYDGVAISVNGGTTWRSVQSLDSVGTAWTDYTVTLDASVASLGGGFGAGFLIRFAEYDDSPAPVDGLAIDDVKVTADENQQIVLDVPASIVEGTGPHDGYILLAFAPTAPLAVSLATEPGGQLSFPTSVVVPAGQTYASFQISSVNDSLVNLSRTITLTATVTGAADGTAAIVVYDDDAPTMQLTLPEVLSEGGPYSQTNATLSIDKAAIANLSVRLLVSPNDEVYLPYSAVIPAGQRQVNFLLSALDDNKIDGNVSVLVTASAPGLNSATARTTTVDNEARTLALLLPKTVQEGGSVTGIVQISGTMLVPLTVSISKTGNAATIPASVTIPIGQTEAAFTISAPDNTARDGSRTVNISAAAATFTSADQSIIVRDNEVVGYSFSSLTDIVNVGGPVSLTVSAADIEGNAISGFAGSAALLVILPDGSSQSVTPSTITLAGATGWTGSITLPANLGAPLRLQARDSSNRSGLSQPLDTLRAMSLVVADMLYDASRNRVYACIPAKDTTANANKIVAIDPTTQQITKTLTVNQNPTKLAITSGAEFLYVALDANGTVAKIRLSDFTLDSTFAVGTSPSYGTLYAADLETVAGQPNLVVVSQYRKSISPSHNGVAVYENGVARPVKTQEHIGSNIIEASADSTIFFGLNTESTENGFRKLQLGPTGMTELEVKTGLFTLSNLDMRSSGNKLFTTSGLVIDGAQLKRHGSFDSTGSVCPDLASNRVYFLEPPYPYSDSFDKVGAYDPGSFARIRRLSLPAIYQAPGYSSKTDFIRWGGNGLAFRTATQVLFISSSRLVPNDASTDLAVTVQATPNPADVGAPLTYTTKVRNLGANPARNTQLGVTLSDSQTIQTVSASMGTPTVSGLSISLLAGDLAPGAEVTLTITTNPLTAGSLTCSAGVSSNAVDHYFSNNTAFKLVSVGFQSQVNAINILRIKANNLIYDPVRKLLWASIPSAVDAPLGKSIISIDPQTGLISNPIALDASPMGKSMALSANGRYLYVGLSDVPDISRIDLTASPAIILRVPLGSNRWGDLGYAVDLEVLDGDGTSVLATTSGDKSALVIDGTTRRTNRTGIYTVNRIEPTAEANVFVGVDNALTRLSVTAAGVEITQSMDNSANAAPDIAGSGNLFLTSRGQLFSSVNLSLNVELSNTGVPCLDVPNGRAYLVNATGVVKAYDTSTGADAGSFSLPIPYNPYNPYRYDDVAQRCVRWGLDGLAILGTDGKIYLTRWSSTIPPSIDSDANGFSDAWETTYFNALGTNPASDQDGDSVSEAFEYFFGSSPSVKSRNPLEAHMVAGDPANVMHLTFPRRVGVPLSAYKYEVSSDLRQWQTPTAVRETVLSTQTVDGVTTETVDAAITCPSAKAGFAHLKWVKP